MSVGVGILIVWFGLEVVGAIVTARVLGRAWRERELIPLSIKVPAGIAAVAGTYGGLGTAMGLIRALGATRTEDTDPSHAARIVAEGISWAMNCTAFGVVTWLPSLLATFVLLRAHARRAQ